MTPEQIEEIEAALGHVSMPWVYEPDDDIAGHREPDAVRIDGKRWPLGRHAALASMAPDMAAQIIAGRDRIAALEKRVEAAEIARLRATLSAITATDCYSRDEVTAMARAALEAKP